SGLGLSLVSDGKTLSTAIGQLKKHTEADAPESIDDLKADPVVTGIFGSLFSGTLIPDLLVADPYDALMEGVTSAKYSGSEQVEGIKAPHLTFAQPKFQWEVWIAAEGDPVIKKVKYDLQRSMAKVPGQNQPATQDFGMIANFKNWKINQPIAADTFVFKAPA